MVRLYPKLASTATAVTKGVDNRTFYTSMHDDAEIICSRQFGYCLTLICMGENQDGRTMMKVCCLFLVLIRKDPKEIICVT